MGRYHAPGGGGGAWTPTPAGQDARATGEMPVQEGRCAKPSVIRKLKVFQADAKGMYFLGENPASQSKLQGGVSGFFDKRRCVSPPDGTRESPRRAARGSASGLHLAGVESQEDRVLTLLGKKK